MDELIQHNELFLSLDHHGAFSSIYPEKILDKINTEIISAYEAFQSGKYVIITLGTSFVYQHIKIGKIVANCHKIPGHQFEKRLLSVDEVVNAYQQVQLLLKDKIVLLTVSPVRHWRDGAMENQRSKSILIESVHQIISQNNNCFYFPAYEIMMDELRDYRFYAEDMLHPNAVAVKYIWERFCDTYFDTPTQQLNKRIEKLRLLLQHRVKNEETNEQRLFEQKVQEELAQFRKDFPDIEL